MLKKIIVAACIGLFLGILYLFLSNRAYIVFKPITEEKISFNPTIQKTSMSVVNIYVENSSQLANKIKIKVGSGVIMTPTGYILTNYHLIEKTLNDKLLVRVLLQNGDLYEATIVGYDKITDLAVLKINADGLPIIKYDPKIKASVGDVVLAIGNPLNIGQSVTIGIVSGINRNTFGNIGRQHFIQTDAAINNGNSGGALINTNGELLGINTFNVGRETAGINFAIPIDLAVDIMHKIIRDGKIIRGYLGVANTFLSKDNGIRITDIIPNGPAAKAGILPNDIVLSIDNRVVNIDDVLDVVAEIKPGTVVKIKLLRNNKILELPVTVEESPE